MGQLDNKALNDNIQEQDDPQQQIKELRELILLLKHAAHIVEDSEKELHQTMKKLRNFLKTK